MNYFQIAALVVFTLFACGGLAALWRGRISRREALLWSLVWLGADVAVLRPDVTSRIANVLGIGRGADLVFYCGIVVMLVGFWTTFVHMRAQQQELTLLVRKLALLDANARQEPGGPRD